MQRVFPNRKITARRIALLAGALLWAFGAYPTLAQETAEGPAPAAETAQTSTAEPPAQEQPVREYISIVDVAVEASRVTSEMQAIRSETVPQFVIRISEDLPVLDAAIDNVAQRIRGARQNSVGSHWLSSIDDAISEIEPQVQSAQEDLLHYAGSLRDKGKAIEAELGLWTRTLERSDDEIPTSVKEEIAGVIADLNTTREVVNSRLESTLGMQTELATVVAKLATVRERADALIVKSRANLFTRDSPPIWKLFTAPAQVHRLRNDLEEYTNENFASVARFISRRQLAVGLVGLIGLAACVFLIRIRRRHAAELATNPRLEKTAALVRHPIAGAILVAIITTPAILPDTPESVSRLIGIILLFPLIRLIPHLVPQHLRRLAYGTVVVYLISRFTLVFPEGAGVARLLNLVSALFVVMGGIAGLRARSTSQNRGRVVTTAVQIAVVLAAASIVSNVAGFAVLASLFAHGVARSAFVGLALLCGLVALLSLYRLLAVIGPLRHVNSLRENPDLVDTQVERMVTYAAVIFWVYRTLEAFGVGSVVLAFLGEILRYEIGLGELTTSIGSIIAFGLAIWVATLISRILRFFLERDVLARIDLPRGVPSAISMMIHYAIITLGLFIALAAAGINLSQISIVVGALGVGIGFGLQTIVNNFISGLILIFERPISVGDKVEFGGTLGEVQRIGIRASTVKTFDGAEIIVPNGNLISNDLINWTLSDQRRRMSVQVGVAYGCDPNQVLELLTRTARETEGVLEHPEPYISFDGFGDSSLDFTVRCWTSRFDEGLRLKSRLAVNIYNALADAGIEIPFPQRDLHVRSIAPGVSLTPQTNPSDPADASEPGRDGLSGPIERDESND